jgi:hypothetical protein
MKFVNAEDTLQRRYYFDVLGCAAAVEQVNAFGGS